jgi:histidinol-phosphatase (PHP family)
MSPEDLERQFAAYVAEGRRLQSVYKGRMDILVGCETEMCSPTSLAEVVELKQRYGLDYIVGSVHHVKGVAIDFDEARVGLAEEACGGSTEALFIAYFDQVCPWSAPLGRMLARQRHGDWWAFPRATHGSC